jgi:hypothetical protein
MAMIKPDDNIPIPSVNCGKPPKHPYRQLQIGQSFAATSKYVNTAMWSRHTGHKYTTRRLIEDGEAVIRVWRVS